MLKQAPLPFTGQKRQFLKQFTQVLNQHINNDGQGWTIVDVFGGSGLLSHAAKQAKPQAEIVYNDFDNYSNRLLAIGDTNRLRQKLITLLKDIPKLQPLTNDLKQQVIETINAFDGFVDIDCLQSWLLFSGPQVSSLDELYKKKMYQCIRLSDYPLAPNYLTGIKVVSQSYRDLIPLYVYKPNTLLVLDPPYVCTSQGAYKTAYFGMVEFLRLMNMVRPPFIFFSSTRSELPAYLTLVLEEKMSKWQNFDGYKTISWTATLNKSASYEDNLIYKF